MALLEKLHARLVDAGIHHCYMLSSPDIPSCVTVAPYNSVPMADIPMSRESFQVAVRAPTYDEALATAWAAVKALEYFPLLSFRQTPTYLGPNEDGSAVCVFNLDVPASWDSHNER